MLYPIILLNTKSPLRFNPNLNPVITFFCWPSSSRRLPPYTNHSRRFKSNLSRCYFFLFVLGHHLARLVACLVGPLSLTFPAKGIRRRPTTPGTGPQTSSSCTRCSRETTPPTWSTGTRKRSRRTASFGAPRTRFAFPRFFVKALHNTTTKSSTSVYAK